MNFRGSNKGRRRVATTLELTPLIDVIFLLLIFFVMTTTPAISAVERLDVDLPAAGGGQAVDDGDQMRVIVQVDPDGAVALRLGDEPEPRSLPGLQELRPELAAIAIDHPRAAIWVQGDVDASHGTVIEILDAASQAGFDRVQMAVRPRGQ